MSGWVKTRNLHSGLKSWLRAQNTAYGMATGSRTIFVDGVNGSDSRAGYDDPASAVASIGQGISLANAWDVIYIAPKAWTSGNLWLGTAYQESATQLSVTYAKQGLAIIGIGHQGLIGPPYGVDLKEVSAATTPILLIHAPMCAVENLSFEATTATDSLYFNGDVAGTSEAALCSVFNCHFHGGGLGSTVMEHGAIYSLACWGMTVDSCTFMGCRTGVMITAGDGTSGKVIVRNCDFFSRLTSASDISMDVCGYALGSTTWLVTNCNFAHLIPSYGGVNRWVNLSDVRQGLVSNCNCGGITGTAYTAGVGGTGIAVATNVGIANCYSDNALMGTP